VYIICILPNSLSRWLFFSGHKVPYQFSLFANTLFSLSGLFNAILFFLTRPDLVVGPSNTPLPNQAANDPRIQHYRSNETELTSYSSQKFGSLPTRNSPGASDYVAPDLEKQYNAYFRPNNNSRMLPEGGGGSLRMPEAGSSLRASDSASHVPSNMSGERSYGDFRSAVSAPVEEETGYGHLPR
jgi:hypothetical protein